MATITTHVLNTATGKPAHAIVVNLYKKHENEWQLVASGKTNNDGRIPGLIENDKHLDQATYKMQFLTQNYFSMQSIISFYPQVEVEFIIYDNSHYHIPLLISPFGYSTYRGS